MQMQQAEWFLLDRGNALDLPELARMCGLSQLELDELVDYGVLQPAVMAAAVPCVGADCVAPLREAARLRGVFDLDLFTVGLLVGYLRRIDLLEQQLRSVRAQVPAHHAEDRDRPAP